MKRTSRKPSEPTAGDEHLGQLGIRQELRPLQSAASLHLSSSASAARQHSRSRVSHQGLRSRRGVTGGNISKVPSPWAKQMREMGTICITDTTWVRRKEEALGVVSNTWIQFLITVWGRFQTLHSYKSKSSNTLQFLLFFFFVYLITIRSFTRWQVNVGKTIKCIFWKYLAQGKIRTKHCLSSLYWSE